MNSRINSAFPRNWFYLELGISDGFIKKLIENSKKFRYFAPFYSEVSGKLGQLVEQPSDVSHFSRAFCLRCIKKNGDHGESKGK